MDTRQQIFENYEVPDPVRIQKVIKFIRKYFNKIEGLDILDCGISIGTVADILSKEGANCIGVDVNPREITGVKIIQADLNNGIPELERKFDIVFAGEIIEHLFDDSKFIRESYKVLKPGGLLIITVPNLVSLINRLMVLFGMMPMTAYATDIFHYHVYNRRKLKKMIKEQNFTLLKATSSYAPFNLFAKIPIIGKIFAFLGDIFPTLGNQLIVFARKE